jgi:DNA-directed RNA polymerase
MAHKYREHKEFWYVYNCDFRGRVYCASPGLSPQGPDFAKGLLRFSTPRELGADGAFWLAVHGANTFGYDKDSFAGRHAWVLQHEDSILGVAADPLESRARSFWGDSDSPYQFLAFCFEWAAYKEYGPGFLSSLPVGLDGSCNGLQNFSAMLRDGVGGGATNLLSSAKPSDIYQQVANVLINRLGAIAETEELARQWLAYGVTRKLTKKPVMTLPYGSTQQSCRESIEDHIRASIETSPWQGREIFQAAVFLSAHLWEAIGVVVIAARNAMGWLQEASRKISKENLPIQWHTPTGFRVFQGSVKWESVRVKTQLCGRCELYVAHDTAEIDARKQAQGVSPNFVHSMDATHLMATVNRGTDITHWAMVHDSYGTYACDIPKLAVHLREAFVNIYKNNDVLNQFRDELQLSSGVQLPPVPPTGELDIEDVLEAEYFFG